LILSGQYKALGAAIGVTRGTRIARVPARGVLRAIPDYVMDTCAHDEAALAGHSRYVSQQWRRLPPERSERRITSQGPLFGKSRFAGQGVWKQLIVVQIICSIGRPRYRSNPVVERRHHANSAPVELAEVGWYRWQREPLNAVRSVQSLRNHFGWDTQGSHSLVCMSADPDVLIAESGGRRKKLPPFPWFARTRIAVFNVIFGARSVHLPWESR
jgi:hypothetical protein